VNSKAYEGEGLPGHHSRDRALSVADGAVQKEPLAVSQNGVLIHPNRIPRHEPELFREQGFGWAELKGLAGSNVNRNNRSVQAQIEQLPAVTAPIGLQAVLRGGLPPMTAVGEVPNVYFVPPGFMRRGGEPSRRRLVKIERKILLRGPAAERIVPRLSNHESWWFSACHPDRAARRWRKPRI
jgi:hypothetical protein